MTNPLGVILKEKETTLVDQVIQSLRIKTESGEKIVSSLSGGNQQKVAIAKWLASKCRIVLFDEPTRGVDVGAKYEIYKLINQLAEEGVAVLMISSYMPELIGMCDRIEVMHEGRAERGTNAGGFQRREHIKTSIGVIKMNKLNGNMATAKALFIRYNFFLYVCHPNRYFKLSIR